MNINSFAIKVRHWFEASLEVPVASATRKLELEGKRMNSASTRFQTDSCSLKTPERDDAFGGVVLNDV